MTLRTLVAASLAGALAWPAAMPVRTVLARALAQSPQFEPRIETRTPGAFDPARPARRAARVRYRADAQVLLPLLITSIRIATRSGVGTASTEVRDVTLQSGERVLAYEFYAASIPERARGLNRLGFIREAVLGGDEGKRQTVYFGAMTVSKEQTLDEAKRAIDRNPDLAAYDVIDGLVTPETATSTSYSVMLPGRAPDARAFFDQARGAVEPAKGKPKSPLKAAPGRPFAGYSFLGAFEELLQAVAAAPAQARGLSRSFVFGGEQRTVEIRDVDPDMSRGREWAGRGLVNRPEQVRRLACRIVAPSWKVDFATWVEASGAPSADPSPLVIPLRVEYQPRAFLRLVFERES